MFHDTPSSCLFRSTALSNTEKERMCGCADERMIFEADNKFDAA